jgi:hypothetical protein
MISGGVGISKRTDNAMNVVILLTHVFHPSLVTVVWVELPKVVNTGCGRVIRDLVVARPGPRTYLSEASACKAAIYRVRDRPWLLEATDSTAIERASEITVLQAGPDFNL